MKRVLSLLLTLVLMLSVLPVSASATSQKKRDGFDVGNTITYGNYEQDNDFTNGPEEINWLIIDRDKNNRILVISQDIIESLPYGLEDEDATWEFSIVRLYLNNDFYEDAFDGLDTDIICEVDVNTPDGRSGTSGGAITLDKIFILSVEQMQKYFPKEMDRKSKPTEFAKEWDAEYDKYGWGWYWARNPGKEQDMAAGIHVGGGINFDGRDVGNCEGVRPAMWLDLNILNEKIANQ